MSQRPCVIAFSKRFTNPLHSFFKNVYHEIIGMAYRNPMYLSISYNGNI